jgi:hypothetical protein
VLTVQVPLVVAWISGVVSGLTSLQHSSNSYTLI